MFLPEHPRLCHLLPSGCKQSDASDDDVKDPDNFAGVSEVNATKNGGGCGGKLEDPIDQGRISVVKAYSFVMFTTISDDFLYEPVPIRLRLLDKY